MTYLAVAIPVGPPPTMAIRLISFDSVDSISKRLLTFQPKNYVFEMALEDKRDIQQDVETNETYVNATENSRTLMTTI